MKHVIDGLRAMKSELEALGCKVKITVEGTELEKQAGNGTRTRDILLGKKEVMVFPQAEELDEERMVTK